MKNIFILMSILTLANFAHAEEMSKPQAEKYFQLVCGDQSDDPLYASTNVKNKFVIGVSSKSSDSVFAFTGIVEPDGPGHFFIKNEDGDFLAEIKDAPGKPASGAKPKVLVKGENNESITLECGYLNQGVPALNRVWLLN